MNIQVTPHTIAITINTNINAGEYNITPCEFTFTEEYEDLTKEAIFSSCDGSVFKVSILNNQCTIPYEVLQQEGNVLLGVYAYETNDDELVLRYSPTPQYFNVKRGSFQVGNDPDLPSPTEWERVLEQINQAIEETNNLNITATKEGKVTTVTITKKDGTTQEVKISDGKDLEFNWEGTSLGVRQEGQSEYDYTDLKGATGDTGATPNIQIGDVQTGDTSEVTRTGTDENPIFNFTLEKGDTGNGIASITKTSTSGLVDTYTITFTNGQTTTYQITNGANGSVVDVQVDGTSVVDNGIANIVGISEIKQELEDMYNLLPKVQGTGEVITLDNTVAGKMLVDLKGNTSQETTTGKNLFKPIQSATKQGITFTANEDGSYTLNGTSTSATSFYVNVDYPIGTYSISANNEKIISGGADYLLLETSGGTSTNKTLTFSVANNKATYEVTSPIVALVVVISSGKTYDNFVIKPQLELGSTTTSFEPYTGNQPSPSPDYPQDIHIVSGDNSIVVKGKNLLNESTFEIGSIDAITGQNSSNNLEFRTSGYIEVDSGTTYTLSNQNYTNYTYRGIFEYDSNKTYIKRTNDTIASTSQGCSLELSSTTKYVRIRYIVGTSITSVPSNMQIQYEKGSTATTYELYQSANYPISLGVKNLWDDNDFQNGYLPTTGSYPTTNPSYPNSRYILIRLNQGQSITIKKLITTNSFRIRYIDVATNQIVGTVVSGTNTYYTSTASYDSALNDGTITANRELLLALWDFTGTLSGALDVTYGTTLQYISNNPIELCKIGNYQDTIVKDNGKWYLNKQIGKVVLNGSESGWSYPSANRFNLDNFANNYLKSEGNTTYISNYYVVYKQTSDNGTFNSLTNNTNYGFNLSSTTSNYYTARFKNTNITSVNDFKTWLSTHNTTIYYVLATPTYTEITDSTLISQLETVKRSFNGQTNISQENNDKPFILDVTALKELTE